MMAVTDMVNIVVWIIIWVVIVVLALVPIGMLWNSIQKWFIKKKIPDKVKKEVENERIKTSIKRESARRRYSELERDTSIEAKPSVIRSAVSSPERIPSFRKYSDIPTDSDSRNKYSSKQPREIVRENGKNNGNINQQPRRSIFD